MKRGMDLVLSALLLLLAMPVLLLAAAIVRLTSPGPALFRQFRMGRDFRPFEILKLRTMAHAHAGLAYTLGPDPRITPFGRWLRRTKIDELPQLWNVLRGDMSLVGPRPVLPELTVEFREQYARLLKVRPGLTDPASLKYCQEARLLAEANDPMLYFKSVVTPDKIRISLEYIERANLWTDMRTIAMTAVICCFSSMSRAYGRVPHPGLCEEVEARESGNCLIASTVAPVGASKSDWSPVSIMAESRSEHETGAWNHLPNVAARRGSTANPSAGERLHL